MAVGLALRVLRGRGKAAAQPRLDVAAVHLGPARQLRLELGLHDLRVRARSAVMISGTTPSGCCKQRQQQMLRLDLAVVIGFRELPGRPGWPPARAE